MKFTGKIGTIALFLILLALAAGCTSPSSPSTPQPSVTAAAPSGTMAAAVTAASTAPVKTASIDTKINLHFNDFACLNIQDAIGKAYLYPDEKYTLSATNAIGSNANVNVLLVDDHDHTAMTGVKPKWDGVQKKWMYEGIVPIVQFNDVTGPVEKTFTIKTQSKYYICADDRKESGVSDVMLQVPVKLQRA